MNKKFSVNNNSEEIEISFTDVGQGNPVILIAGWPLSKEMWEYQTEALVNNGHRVIAYDRRGFGQSSKPWSGYDYDSLTDDLFNLINHLQLTNITLIGFSMGGGEVVRYFSKYGGENVSKVVLISSVTPYLLLTDNNPDGVPQEKFDEMLQGMKEDRLAFLNEFGKTFFGVSLLNKPISVSSLEYYKTLESMASPKATQECAKSFSSTDFRNEMKLVNVPALIIHGYEDKTVPIKPTGEQSAVLIQNNRYVIYEDAPHGLWFTHKERLNQDLIEFLNSEIQSSDKTQLTSQA